MLSMDEKPCFFTNEHPIAAVKLSLRQPTAPGHFLSICGGPRVDLWGLRAVCEKIIKKFKKLKKLNFFDFL